MKLLTIVGARPQFIKAAAFSDVFRSIKDNQEILVHTGQHYDENMSAIFFDELKLSKPNYNLEVGSGNHGQQTAKMLEGVENILLAEKPDGVLVYGDTNSTLAGALAASKLHIPVFHVEAGLRSYNKLIPEEQNRVLTDHISSLLFCPTENAVHNLKKEAIIEGVYNTGDIMFDSILRNIHYANQAYENSRIVKDIFKDNGRKRDLDTNGYYLATIHRPINTDDEKRLITIFNAFEKLDRPVIMPLHPRTKKHIMQLELKLHNVKIIEPVGYLLMLFLIKNAYMILTDSGGVQKESFILKVPCTTFREETEWTETLANGWNVLCPVHERNILKIVNRQLTCLNDEQPQIFGEGNASEKICKILMNGASLHE